MTSTLPQPPAYYVEKMRLLQTRMRDDLLTHLHAQEQAMTQTAVEESLAGVADVRGGDTIYTIDAHSEEILFDFCREWAKEAPFVLIAEGIEGSGWKPFPETATVEEAAFLMIVDPIDGTRNIMYNKRSAWILSAVAPNRGEGTTTLADIEAAVMTELPTTRHLFSDQLWATPGGGAHREAHNLLTGERKPLPLRPSRTEHLAHGFAAIAKFFPPAKTEIAALETRLLERVAPEEGENPLVFDDEYITTGGQLYEILVGHDRFLADLRPVFFEALNLPNKLVCHPYDICTELIAREAGVIVTDEHGEPLAAPLDIRAPVSWVAYANPALQARIEPHLQELLNELRTGALAG
ncbi:MAG: hypothetical protein OHK0029_42770 [Armatimonadaceae bacterium]